MRALFLSFTVGLVACNQGTIGACELDEFPGTCLDEEYQVACDTMGANNFTKDARCTELGYVECPEGTEREIEAGDGTSFALVDDPDTCTPY